MRGVNKAPANTAGSTHLRSAFSAKRTFVQNAMMRTARSTPSAGEIRGHSPHFSPLRLRILGNPFARPVAPLTVLPVECGDDGGHPSISPSRPRSHPAIPCNPRLWGKATLAPVHMAVATSPYHQRNAPEVVGGSTRPGDAGGIVIASNAVWGQSSARTLVRVGKPARWIAGRWRLSQE